MKQLFEFFPLIVFFAVYYKSDKDLYISIAAVIVASLISLVALYIKERKIPTVMLVTTIIVVIFGGLSLYFKSEMFFKMKPTIINSLFALALIISTYINKPILKMMLNSSIKLTDPGWTILNKMWTGYFIFLAILNEIVWRNYPTDIWVNFKVFGIMGVTIAFTVIQIPILKKYFIE
jgi:intracellular septation protein|tara:strand:+ start:53 stop:583 length:531 start_codon:yes stop_codon:yes gene_type:complete